MATVDVGHGVRLFVQDWGTGKPIVFIHGWPFSHRQFEYQMVPLALRGFRVVGVDLRGFGYSDKPWTGHDYDTWAADVARVLAAFDLRDVTLAGFNMGGAIAMHYAATLNDPRVTRLALLAAAGPSLAQRPDHPRGVPREQLDGMVRTEALDRARFKRQFGAQLFHKEVSAELARWLERIGLEASARASLRGLEELRDRDLRGELRGIRVPVRIFHGVHDQVVPFALGEEQAQLIRGATLVRFEDSGHALFYEERDKLTEELARFAA
jgi:pimeloyl-ACP methyl ester carboxylesterase